MESGEGSKNDSMFLYWARGGLRCHSWRQAGLKEEHVRDLQGVMSAEQLHGSVWSGEKMSGLEM